FAVGARNKNFAAPAITSLANRYWVPHVKNKLPFDPKVLEDVYEKEILKSVFAIRKIMLLEFRENVPACEVFKKVPSHFPYLFKCVMEDVSLKEQTVLLVFLHHRFNSLEVDLIREQMQQLILLPMWMCLLPVRAPLSLILHLRQREEEGHLFCKLLDMLFYTGFGINDQTGNALTEKETTTLHYNRITSLQKAAFAHIPELQDFALSNVGAVDTQESLTKQFGHLSPITLHRVASYLCLLPELAEGQDTTNEKEVLLELLVSRHERRISQIEQLNQMTILVKVFCLSLPKRSLQFLTLHDCLLRNFNLSRLESTYEIRHDVEDVVTPIAVNLNVRDHIKHEWEGLRKHDVCFLVTVWPNLPYGTRLDRRQPFVEQTGLAYVSGCEVQGMLDDKDRVIEEDDTILYTSGPYLDTVLTNLQTSFNAI
uniref:Uncharacterized protein n=1 Tax=Salmo trutta TaxID=8032 RepID=A0A673Z151_SALTR